MYVHTQVWMDGWMDVWMGDWMDGQMNGEVIQYEEGVENFRKSGKQALITE